VLKQLSDNQKIYAFHEKVILIYFGDNDVITLFNIGVHLKKPHKGESSIRIQYPVLDR
jgi:hypothetical protein